MVGNAALRIVVGSYSLASVSRSHLTLALGSNSFVLLGELHIVEFSFEHLHSLVAVLELASFFLTFYNDTGRLVGKSYGRFSLVYVLTARAA